MIGAIGKALAAVGDRSLRGVVWRSIGLTFLLLAIAGAGGFYGLRALPTFQQHWLNTLVEVLAGAGLVVGVVLLAYPIAALLIGIFLDDVAAAVEARDFSADPPGKPLGVGASLSSALGFVVAVIGLNLLALPIYLFVPGPNIAVGLLVNGYLVGREYFELVALRHARPDEVHVLRRRHRAKVYGAGIVIALMLGVPVLNLLAPVFGTALMVHVFKNVEKRHASVG